MTLCRHHISNNQKRATSRTPITPIFPAPTQPWRGGTVGGIERYYGVIVRQHWTRQFDAPPHPPPPTSQLVPPLRPWAGIQSRVSNTCVCYLQIGFPPPLHPGASERLLRLARTKCMQIVRSSPHSSQKDTRRASRSGESLCVCVFQRGRGTCVPPWHKDTHTHTCM